MSYPFNVRVYGILIDHGRVLIADEFFHNTFITKFPGGGLQFGEGTHDCLIREFKEEIGIRIQILRHFYTTDFFLPSAFDAEKQIISIYYLVNSPDISEITVSDRKMNPFECSNGDLCFRWLSLELLKEEEFTFPADKKVAAMLKEENQK
jgi:8-oxo-dGTP pyrophosphatase MutT (NUDIX family)